MKKSNLIATLLTLFLFNQAHAGTDTLLWTPQLSCLANECLSLPNSNSISKCNYPIKKYEEIKIRSANLSNEFLGQCEKEKKEGKANTPDQTIQMITETEDTSTAKSDDGLLAGTQKLACEAMMCLSVPNPTSIRECVSAVTKYEMLKDISAGLASAFLAKCPVQ